MNSILNNGNWFYCQTNLSGKENKEIPLLILNSIGVIDSEEVPELNFGDLAYQNKDLPIQGI